MNNKISIIVPVYNVEKYLKKCVDSIINQSYQNLEIILVDDGSPDNCGKLCDNFAENDKRIKVIHQNNGGLSAARNAGIDVATGNYIAFVDSDDFIHPQTYELLLNLLLKNDCDMTICNLLEVEEDETIDYVKKVKDISSENVEDHSVETVLGWLFSDKGQIATVAWNKLYKISLFDGIRYPVGKLHEDVFTTYKIIAKCKNIMFLNEELYFYVQRNNSITGNKFTIKSLDYLEALRESKLFFSNDEIFFRKFEVEKFYLQYLIDYYVKVYLYCKNQKEKQKDIENEFKAEYKNRRSDMHLTFKEKIKFNIVYRLPEAWILLKLFHKFVYGDCR